MSTRFSVGQKDYITKLNELDDEFQAAIAASPTGLMNSHEAAADPHTQYAKKSGADFTGAVSVDGLLTAKQSLKFDGAGEGLYWGGGGTAVTGDDTGGAQKVDVTVGGAIITRFVPSGVQSSYSHQIRSTAATANLQLINDQADNVTVNTTFNSLDFVASSGAAKAASIKGNIGQYSDQVGLSFFTSMGGVAYGERMRLDYNGNLGLGVTPSAWGGLKTLQVGQAASFGGNASAPAAYMTSNAYYDGTNWKYITSQAASNITLAAGGTGDEIHFRQAAVGTVGATVSWTQAMTLNASGNLGIGTTAPTYRLDVGGASTATSTSEVVARFKATTTGDMADGFGVTQLFSIQDNAGANRNIAQLRAVRDGADDRGAFVFAPYLNGAATERVRITTNGYVGIGTNAPTRNLEVVDPLSASIHVAQTSATPTSAIFFAGSSGFSGIGTQDATPFVLRTNNAERMRLDASGNLLVGATSGSAHTIQKSVAEGFDVLFVQGSGTYFSTLFKAVGANGYNTAQAAQLVGKHSTNGRSINAAGTINASGADYAEYMRKSATCGILAKGQIVGVNAEGKLTDKWAEAVSFLIKSTDPSYVGGDTWGSEEALGMVRPTDTEAEDYAERLAAFNAALEEARQAVDRIAYAGQVPVNIYGANVGDYIVPVQDGEGIKGIAMGKADMGLSDYMVAVGIVQNILPDGRANVRVKVC